MPRPPKAIKTSRLDVALPEDLRARMDAHLASKIDGKIPQGAYQELFVFLLNQYFIREKPNLIPKNTTLNKVFNGLSYIQEVAGSGTVDPREALTRIERWAATYKQMMMEMK